MGVIATGDYTKYDFFAIYGQNEREMNIHFDHTIPQSPMEYCTLTYLNIVVIGGSTSDAGHPVLITETEIKVGAYNSSWMSDAPTWPTSGSDSIYPIGTIWGINF